MTVSIAQVADLDGVDQWQAVEEQSVPFDQPGLLADPLEETTSMFTAVRRSERHDWYLGCEGEDVLGNGMLNYPLLDNLENGQWVSFTLRGPRPAGPYRPTARCRRR